MIESTLYEFLKTELAPVPVFLVVPETAPKKYVVFEKTPSGKTNFIKSSVFAFKSVAPTLAAAAKLNEDVKNAVENSIVLDVVISAKLNSDYNFSDTERKINRYQAVYDIRHY